MAAQFEIRQKQLASARKILGLAIGTAPKSKIFKTYINIELQLGNVDRCRTLYEKYLEWNAANCQVKRLISIIIFRIIISLGDAEFPPPACVNSPVLTASSPS
eukprot:320168-Prorocentrum_minimum.AAC.2